MRKKETEPRAPIKWQTVGHPGFFGESKDLYVAEWNASYTEGGWRLAWELSNGEILDYNGVFYQVFVPGYVQHFRVHPDQAVFLTQNYSYCYDCDLISPKEAFDPYALYDCPGKSNQQHAVAINIALDKYLGMPFVGRRPLQVRENLHDSSTRNQPEGYLWSPGRIATVRPDLIPRVDLENVWWQRGSIVDLYQRAKILQIKQE
jgi:hypothetical protein